MPLLVYDQVNYSRYKDGGDRNPSFSYNLSNHNAPACNLIYFSEKISFITGIYSKILPKNFPFVKSALR